MFTKGIKICLRADHRNQWPILRFNVENALYRCELRDAFPRLHRRFWKQDEFAKAYDRGPNSCEQCTFWGRSIDHLSSFTALFNLSKRPAGNETNRTLIVGRGFGKFGKFGGGSIGSASQRPWWPQQKFSDRGRRHGSSSIRRMPRIGSPGHSCDVHGRNYRINGLCTIDGEIGGSPG